MIWNDPLTFDVFTMDKDKHECERKGAKYYLVLHSSSSDDLNGLQISLVEIPLRKLPW